MGTNFYFANSADDHCDPKVHIGKLSASGPWCNDCGTTFMKHGTQYVHTGKEMQKSCPLCGITIREVSGSCSFVLATTVHVDVLKEIAIISPDSKIVEDEYGTPFTAKEMLDIIDNCKILFQCPEWFS